jgi:hypothetical protein
MNKTPRDSEGVMAAPGSQSGGGHDVGLRAAAKRPTAGWRNNRLHFLAEIQNLWYNNRHRPAGTWRPAERAVAAERRLYTT